MHKSKQQLINLGKISVIGLIAVMLGQALFYDINPELADITGGYGVKVGSTIWFDLLDDIIC